MLGQRVHQHTIDIKEDSTWKSWHFRLIDINRRRQWLICKLGGLEAHRQRALGLATSRPSRSGRTHGFAFTHAWACMLSCQYRKSRSSTAHYEQGRFSVATR